MWNRWNVWHCHVESVECVVWQCHVESVECVAFPCGMQLRRMLWISILCACMRRDNRHVVFKLRHAMHTSVVNKMLNSVEVCVLWCTLLIGEAC